MRREYLLNQFAYTTAEGDVDVNQLEWTSVIAADYWLALDEGRQRARAAGLDEERVRIFHRIQAVAFTPWQEVDEHTDWEELINQLDPVIEI